MEPILGSRHSPQGFRWHLAVETSRLAPMTYSLTGKKPLLSNAKNLSVGISLLLDTSGTEAGIRFGKGVGVSPKNLGDSSLPNPI